MNRESYLKELNRRLKRLPDAEREEAIEWYKEYFDEAGEEKALSELGSPRETAAQIAGKLTLDDEKKGRAPGLRTLIALAFPIAAPVGIALLAVLLTLVIAVFAVLAALIAAGVACAAYGILDIAYVVFSGFSSLANFAFYLGCGMTSLGLGAALVYFSYRAIKGLIAATKRALATRMTRKVSK